MDEKLFCNNRIIFDKSSVQIFSGCDIIMGINVNQLRRSITMIDFKEEISKYKPARTVEEVDSAVRNEILDIMDLLQYISGRTDSKK